MGRGTRARSTDACERAYTHPRVFATANGGLPDKMKLVFYVSLLDLFGSPAQKAC